MGLDQYLSAKKYLSPAEWRGEQSKEQFEGVLKTVGAETYVRKEFPSAEVSVSVGYWRKANAIHQWFVDNCQDGMDDCRSAIVERGELQTLKSLCETILLEHQVTGSSELAKEELPTQSGFFFGGTEYDEYYYSDLLDTIEIVKACLEMPTEWDFSYQSSW